MKSITYLPIQDSFTSTYLCQKDVRGTFSEIAKSNINKNHAWNQIRFSTSNAF